MRKLSLKLAFLVWALFLVGGQPARPSALPASARQAAPTSHRKRQVKVWVNTRSGVYHCPGTRWYGKTQHGKYMGECEARAKGYRPAYDRPCGSECRK